MTRSPGSATLTSAHVSNSRLRGSNFTPTSTFRPSAPSPINFIGRVPLLFFFSSSFLSLFLSLFTFSLSLSFVLVALSWEWLERTNRARGPWCRTVLEECYPASRGSDPFQIHSRPLIVPTVIALNLVLIA